MFRLNKLLLAACNCAFFLRYIVIPSRSQSRNKDYDCVSQKGTGGTRGSFTPILLSNYIFYLRLDFLGEEFFIKIKRTTVCVSFSSDTISTKCAQHHQAKTW